MKRFAALAVLACLFVGCSTVEYTSPGIMEKFDVVGAPGQAVETAAVRNSGWTLFYIIPLLYGDVTWDPEANDGQGDIKGGLTLFRDRCNVSDCYETLQAIARQRGYKLSDVSLVDNSEITLGFTGYAQLVGCFFESNDVIASGVLCKPVKK